MYWVYMFMLPPQWLAIKDGWLKNSSALSALARHCVTINDD